MLTGFEAKIVRLHGESVDVTEYLYCLGRVLLVCEMLLGCLDNG